MAKKTKPAPVETADVEAVGKPGLGIDEGIILTTSLLLAIAITLVVLANKAYGA
jgi:hypothetical protein